MKAFLILTLLLTYSCTKYAEISKDSASTTLEPVQMSIERLNEVKWLVGKPKETYVSQSFVFVVNMPRVREEDLEFLTKQNGIDAWILRVIVNRGSETQDLGSLYTTFKPKRITRGNQNTGPASSVTVKVFYAAAYASERFRAFPCPAFGHNLKIKDLDIVGDATDFSMTMGLGSSYGEKSHLVELTPSSFNGGNSLTGEYFVEIAPYDSRNKTIHAPFKRLSQSVVIKGEKQISVKSCAGVRSELQQ